MGKLRRGGYVFVTWKGDHSPKHVHVYKNGRLACKWDLENNLLMKGHATQTVLAWIARLCKEELL